MMFLEDFHKTSLSQPKPKLGFSIAELVGNPKELESPSIPIKSPSIDPKLSIEDASRDNFGFPHVGYFRSYEPVAQSRLPIPLSLFNHDLQHVYHPWHLNRHIGILPHKMQGADAFLFHPFRKPKRIRTAFAPTQLLQLEHAFEKNHYVVGSERRELAQALNLSETQVKVWFQNRRTKYKRQKQDDQEEGKNTDFSESELQSTSSDDESAEMPSPGFSEIRQSEYQSNYKSAIMNKTNSWSPICSSSSTVPSNTSTFET